MKKAVLMFVILCLFSGCGQQSDLVERLEENGIEVVLNRAEPYRIPKAWIPKRLEEEFVINLEDEAVAQTGIYQLDTFAADSNGHVYILNLSTEDNHIYQFHPDGTFSRSFGRHGQGPGELARPIAILLTDEEELMVTDPNNTKLVYFSTEGNLLREVHVKRMIPFVQPLKPSRFVVFGRTQPAPDRNYLRYPLELCDENLDPIKMLDEFLTENAQITQRIRGIQPGFGLAVGGGSIFIGNEERNYEIWVFDDEGTLVRKIRKTHVPIPVSEAIKKEALARYNEQMKSLVFFPKFLPPFRTMTADENGILYVVTFEEGDAEGENRIDVFSEEGAFIGQLSASVFVSMNTPVNTIVRGGRFYYIREKESGFKELVVEKIVADQN
jgi:hypothetical protein